MILLFCFLQPKTILVSISHTFQSVPSRFSQTQFQPAVRGPSNAKLTCVLGSSLVWKSRILNFKLRTFVIVFFRQVQLKNQNKYSKMEIQPIQIDELPRTLDSNRVEICSTTHMSEQVMATRMYKNMRTGTHHILADQLTLFQKGVGLIIITNVFVISAALLLEAILSTISD